MLKPLISVVLGSYNRKKYLKLTIDSVRKELLNFSYEIIVVDGGSDDGSVEWLLKQKDIVTIIQHNRGEWLGKKIERRSWGYFMNLAFKAAQGKYICMISDDCLVVPGAIKNGYKKIEDEIEKGNKIGSVAFYFRNWPENKKYFVGFVFGKMMVNHGIYLKQALEDVNYIDEESYMFYCADGDLSMRLWRAGYSCVDSTSSFIEHFSHANKIVRRSNNRSIDKDTSVFAEKWKQFGYENDPTHPKMKELDFVDKNNTALIYKRKFWLYLFLVRVMIYMESNSKILYFYKKISKYLPI